ncbi:MAG: M20 family metallopeptidase [Bacteroidota bacterium]
MYNHLKETIQQQAKAQHQDIIQLRRHLHAHPELSFQEYHTAKFIAQNLTELGIEFSQGIAGTGLMALVKGKHPSKGTVALRADMDALPIREVNDVPYKSQNEGVMHACGHDVHTASLLGVARILSGLKEAFEGTVKLIFQPGEEKNPGGASRMIQEGVLEHPRPASILGQHVDPKLPVGKVGFMPGTMMASADELYLTVRGRGGHAAAPHLVVDPILIAAHIVVAMQQMVSRACKPTTPSVLSLCKIAGGTTTNVVPGEVKLLGTFRTVDEAWRATAHKKMMDLASGIAQAMGGSCTLEINKGYPSLHSDPALTQKSMVAAKEFLAPDQVVDLELSMGAEDFAYYAQQLPGCFYFLGVQNNARGINAHVHTPTFDIDEKALEIGPGLMAWLALHELCHCAAR